MRAIAATPVGPLLHPSPLPGPVEMLVCVYNDVPPVFWKDLRFSDRATGYVNHEDTSEQPVSMIFEKITSVDIAKSHLVGRKFHLEPHPCRQIPKNFLNRLSK